MKRPRKAAAGRVPAREGSRLTSMGLTSSQARCFYDRFGRAQDLQAFYEDPAAGELLARARLGQAQTVFELGCGTGRMAARLLRGQLPAGARYLGADISSTMTSLASARLRHFGRCAEIIRADATRPLPLASATFDRFLAIYVLDLLSPGDAAAVTAEARRLLRPGGLLGIVSLTADGPCPPGWSPGPGRRPGRWHLGSRAGAGPSPRCRCSPAGGSSTVPWSPRGH